MILIFLDSPGTRAALLIETVLAHDPAGRAEILDEFDRLLRDLPTPAHRNPKIRDLVERFLADIKKESGLSAKKGLRMEL